MLPFMSSPIVSHDNDVWFSLQVTSKNKRGSSFFIGFSHTEECVFNLLAKFVSIKLQTLFLHQDLQVAKKQTVDTI